MPISPFLSHHTASPAVSGGLCPSHPWAVSTDGAPGPRHVCGPGCGRLKFPLATHVPNTCTDHLFHPLVPKAVLNASHRRFFLDCHASPERVERESSSPLSEVQEGLTPAGRCPCGHVALGSSCTACSLSFGRAVSLKQSYRQETARLRQCPYVPARLTSRPFAFLESGADWATSTL